MSHLPTSLIGQLLAQVSQVAGEPHPGRIQGSMPFLEMRGPILEDIEEKAKPAPRTEAPDSAAPNTGNSGTQPSETETRPSC